MSRGPGRIQQAIIRASEANPCAVFTAAQLIAIAYPGVTPEDKHRVAALRAARQLAKDSPRFDAYSGSSKAGGMLLTNAANCRSLAIGRVFEHFAGTKPVAECAAFLDDPTSDAYPEGQPDGFFDLLARRNKAWAEWRDEEAEALTAIINERVEREKRDRTDLGEINPQVDVATRAAASVKSQEQAAA